MAKTDGQEVRAAVEQLAIEVVMADGCAGDAASPEWLAGVRATVASVEEQAALLGWHGAAEAARRLAANAREGATWGAVKAGLEQGLAELEAALERAGTGDAGGGAGAAQAPAAPAVQAPAASSAFGALAEDRELLGDFVLETRDHLQGIEAGLLNFEQSGGTVAAIHGVFRAFHSIKGLAGFLELGEIREVAHEVETLLGLARDGQLEITPDAVDLILEAADYLNHWVRALEAKLAGGLETPPTGAQALLERVRATLEAGLSGAPPGAAEESVIEMPASPLVSVSAPPAGEPAPQANPVAEAPEPEREGAAGKARSAGGGDYRAVKVHTAKLDYLVDMVGELVIAQSLVQHDPDLALHGKPRLAHNISQLARITDEVQRTAMSMRMVPVGPMFQKMSRLVRDLARKSSKQAELEMSGETTELDRTIVEHLADPLMHMVRNSLDHGVEPPEERVAAGKNPVARVSLRARHESGHIVVEVSDDGRGLNRQRILDRARRNGLVGASDSPGEQETYALIFEPGFSTAEQVTDVSGRGVGMDVVRRNVQKLRGRIEVHSEPGRGTTFQLKLPLTLAIIDGLVVGVGEERYIVPIFAVKEIVRATSEILSTVSNRHEMAMVRGELLPVLRLRERFALSAPQGDGGAGLLIVTNSSVRRFCVLVDSLIGKQEVVIKGLGETFKHVVGLAGAAILGDGRVGLILDPEALFAGGGRG